MKVSLGRTERQWGGSVLGQRRLLSVRVPSVMRARRGSFCISRLRPPLQLDSSLLIHHLTVHFQQNQCQCNARVRRVSQLPHFPLAISFKSCSAFFFPQVTCGISRRRRSVPRPQSIRARANNAQWGLCCRCPAPPTAPPTALPTAPPGSARRQPPLASVVSVAHNAATYARLLKDVQAPHPLKLPPTPTAPIPSASRYFLNLSCQLMSCQTGSDLSRDYAGKVRKRGSFAGSSSSSQLVWSVHRHSEGVAEARRARTTGRGRCVNELRGKMRKK